MDTNCERDTEMIENENGEEKERRKRKFDFVAWSWHGGKVGIGVGGAWNLVRRCLATRDCMINSNI